jgi:two-component system nitrate/nitrite response regulator NarL
MINEADGVDVVHAARKSILICDTQPVAVEGMKWLIENSGDLRFAGSVDTLDRVFDVLNPEAAKAEREAAHAAAELAAAEAMASAREAQESRDREVSVLAILENQLGAGAGQASPDSSALEVLETALDRAPNAATDLRIVLPERASIPGPIDAVVIDKGVGMGSVMDLLQKLTSTSHPTPTVIWGASVSEAEALRLLQAGARGILRRTSESGTLLTCLRAVTSGGTWMEDGIFGSAEKLFNPKRSELTQREREVVLLVEKGLRNRDIARMLGIQIGTVKIHLKHIFEKTGVRGRYGLAYTGLQNKGSIPLTTPTHFSA